LTPKSKFILLNSPCNPSGAVYNRQELEALADVVRSHPHVMVIADEIYEYIIYDTEHISIGSLPGMRDRVITVNGFSKGYAMTGWRLGYVAAPREIASACSRMQGMLTAGANPFVQLAGVEALNAGRKDCINMTASYRKRRDLVVQGLKAIPAINVSAPEGTFYIFPEISSYLGVSAGNQRIETAEELCMWLLNEHGLAIVPGGAFGADTCVRISFAASEKDIVEGIKRLEKALALLS
ncbi:MAG: aminotransferase class I/II-fold pyridoxal phosphate-dependent enzyme, partial [Hyphomicrobiales bacterium]